MSFRHAAPLLAAIALFACSSNTSAPEPTEPSSEAPVAKSAADLALIAETQASEDMRDKIKILEEGQWQGGDFTQATIEHSERGDAVAVRFNHDTAGVDLVYTRDDDGKPMALVRPVDAASAQILASSLADEDPGLEGMSPAELAALPLDTSPEDDLEPESKVQLGVTTETESTATCGHLFAGQTLKQNQKLWSCKNGYALYMQPDGNLVLYAPGSRATWSSKTNGKGGYKAVMQTDGNFVVYNKSGKALWASGHRHAGDQLDLQNDGNLVKNTCGSVSWSTGTYCESGCVGVCKKWSCGYISKEGNHPSCFALSGNPFGRYHIQTTRTGRTIPGFCGTGLYADWKGDGISCPTSHVFSMFVCDN